MSAGAVSVVEHIDYRTEDHGAFVAAFLTTKPIRLAARGCRRVELTRGIDDRGHDYRVHVEWRTRAELEAFAASEASAAIAQTMAPFTERARQLDERIASGGEASAIEAKILRQMFGHYPTGIAFVTATGPEGPVGMLVTSFTSVSLAPALVAFCAAHTSTTWPIIADARACAVNLLAASQKDLCHALATKKVGRFDGVDWAPAKASGAPILGGVVGWLDCRIADVGHAGDHDLVLLEVLGHSDQQDVEPLVFHRSGYRTLV